MAAYRASEHSATGFSPNKIMLGRECRAPIDLVLGTPGDPDVVFSPDKFVRNKQEQMIYCYAAVREHLGESAQRRKHTYDMTVKPKRFQIGQKVWYYYPRRYKSRSPKWQRFYTGPFEVIRQIGPLNYILRKCNGRKELLAHVDKMKACRTEESQLISNPNEQNDRCEVEFEPLEHDREIVTDVPRHQRPKRTTRPPARFNDYVVCSVYTRNLKVKHVAGKTQSPTPRPCSFCREIVGSRALMHKHVQGAHRDILNQRRKQRQAEDLIRHVREVDTGSVGMTYMETAPTPCPEVLPLVGVEETSSVCQFSVG